MSIAAPATNPASDLELKLPATIGSANQLLKNSGTAGTLEFSSLTESTGALGLTGSGNTTFDISTGNNSGDNSKLSFSDTADTGIGSINYDHGTNSMQFAVAGQENMRVTSAGYLHIGSNTSSAWIDSVVKVRKDQNTVTRLAVRNEDTGSDASAAIALNASGNSWTLDCGSSAKNSNSFTINKDATGNSNQGYEKFRIDTDGRVGINLTTTTNYSEMLQVKTSGADGYGIAVRHESDGTGSLMRFATTNGLCGSINGSATSTSFNTSSDYRLKENEVAISDGITRLKTLKPYRFNFKVDPDTTVDGFFAHEVTAVPEAIAGTKDKMKSLYYEEGDTIPSGKKVGDFKEFSTTEIDPQGIDQSKLVPLLTAALQEAITKIETLETKVAALEAA